MVVGISLLRIELFDYVSVGIFARILRHRICVQFDGTSINDVDDLLPHHIQGEFILRQVHARTILHWTCIALVAGIESIHHHDGDE